MVRGGRRCHSTRRRLKNVIRGSVMSNLQQSHHQTGVEVDASTSTPPPQPCRLQFSLQGYPCGRKHPWEQRFKDRGFISQMDGKKCIDTCCMYVQKTGMA